MLLGWCTENFDYLDELVDTRLTWENRLAQHELSDYAADRPDIDTGGVIRIAKDKLRRTIVAGTDVTYVWLTRNELFGTTEVAQFEDVASVVAEDVLRLNIPMAYTFRMDVGDRAHQLVRIKFDDQVGNHCLALEVLLHHTISGIRNVVHNDI